MTGTHFVGQKEGAWQVGTIEQLIIVPGVLEGTRGTDMHQGPGGLSNSSKVPLLIHGRAEM